MDLQKSSAYKQNMGYITSLKNDETTLELEIKSRKGKLEFIQGSLYLREQDKIHMEEIFRLASIEFNRLRRQTGQDLTQQDVDELDKLIKRTKSPNGLEDIVKALAELRKYYPDDIRTNLYGLLQRIIIGGPYGGWRKRKK
jgi:hypothetical protein